MDAATQLFVRQLGEPPCSSYKPFSRRRLNRARHLQTVTCDIRSRLATLLLSFPSAHTRTIRAIRELIDTADKLGLNASILGDLLALEASAAAADPASKRKQKKAGAAAAPQ